MYKLTSECHIIPIPEEKDQFAAYFPLKSLILRLNKDGADILTELKHKNLRGGKDTQNFLDSLVGLGLVNGPEDRMPKTPHRKILNSTNVMLLTTESCNLRCLYCYAEGGKGQRNMSLQTAKAAVKHVSQVAAKTRHRQFQVLYHGGGEPTVNWLVLKKSLEYGQELARKNKLKANFGIVTNAVFSIDKAQWIVENFKNGITVSIDGPQDINDLHRPMASGKGSYERVARNLNYFDKAKFPYTFRVTVTNHSQDRIMEICDHLVNKFNPRSIQLEHNYVCGRGVTEECDSPDRDTFVGGYLAAREKYKDRISLWYSGGRFDHVSDMYCGAAAGSFIITPSGRLTTCLEVCSDEDPRAEVFHYGEHIVNSDDFVVWPDRVEKFAGFRVHNFETCKGCLAKWHCAGDCPAKVPSIERITEERDGHRCHINRTILIHELLDRMDSGALLC